MTVSGIVITLSPDPGLSAQAIDTLTADPRFELGELSGARLPVVLETETLYEQRDTFQALTDVDGVTFASLVYVEQDLDGDRSE